MIPKISLYNYIDVFYSNFNNIRYLKFRTITDYVRNNAWEGPLFKSRYNKHFKVFKNVSSSKTPQYENVRFVLTKIHDVVGLCPRFCVYTQSRNDREQPYNSADEIILFVGVHYNVLSRHAIGFHSMSSTPFFWLFVVTNIKLK